MNLLIVSSLTFLCLPRTPRQSDPVKVAKSRSMQRLRQECVASGRCRSSDLRLLNATRLMLKSGEHTWGLDAKSTLLPAGVTDPKKNWMLHSNWSNDEFEMARRVYPQYQQIEDSWRRQRMWAIEAPLAALGPNHTLAQAIEDDFGEMSPVIPNPSAAAGWVRHQPADAIDCGRLRLVFDEDGSIVSAQDRVYGVDWAGPHNKLARLSYHTYVSSWCALRQHFVADVQSLYSSSFPQPTHFGPLLFLHLMHLPPPPPPRRSHCSAVLFALQPTPHYLCERSLMLVLTCANARTPPAHAFSRPRMPG